MASSTSQKKYGTILGYVYTVLQAVIGIVYIPILLNGIGKAEYGIYQVVGSIVSYFAAMESPLCASILKYYVEYKAKGDEMGMENVLAIGRNIFRGLSVVMIVLAVPSIILIRIAFADTFSPSELFETQMMFVVMIANIIITMNTYVYIAAINGHERFVFLKITAIIALILQPITVVLLISQYQYAFVIVVTQLVYNIIMAIIRYYYSKRKLNCRVQFHYKDKNLFKGIAKLTFATFFVAIADQIFWRTDQLILGSMCGPEVTAEYSIGAQFNTMYILVACVLGGVLLPTITKIIVDGDNRVLSDYFAKIGRFQSYLVSLMLYGFICFGQEVIKIIAGDGFEISYSVAILMMIPYAIDLIQTCGGSILTAKNMYEYRAITLFAAAVVNIGITILFVKMMGPVGAALSTTICIILASGLTMNIIYGRVLKLDLKHFFKEVVPIWALGALMLPVSALLINKIAFSNIYIQFIVHCVLFFLLFCGLMLPVLHKDEKALIFGKIGVRFYKNSPNNREEE